ncbi:hypothetical protein GQ55_8G054100 [Panicum hallii var. hallii]|uniref:Retrotransposon gag domain-containing protein n=1 Tax=Panicum hallii var. hallii TaxID=1504633 RepID=A0A2T7CL85_9POAL|nr:hypothetical protein GQ55_8G054100 [Panicum hallii var. hallii]
MNRILAHNPYYEPVFFATKFVDGHCDDIRFMILLHRPKDLDTAYALASLQESNRSGFRGGLDKGEVQNYIRSVNRVQASPVPPPRLTLEGGSSSDRRVSISKMGDDKFSAMKAYRRARGQCYKCGEKWSHTHRCSPTVQIHVVEELLELLQTNEPVITEVMAADGTEGLRTVRLVGRIDDQKILILVDFGSSHSFISTQAACKLQRSRTTISPMKVKVANGTVLQCNIQLSDGHWTVQGYTFCTNFRVIELSSYDVVLGMD